MATTAQASPSIITIIEDNTLIAYAPALETFFAAVVAANGDPNKMLLAVLQLQANVLAATPNAEAALIGQLVGAINAKVQALVAQAQANLKGS